MKLKLFVCLSAMIALLPLQAVVIVENGKSDYQIVVPESCGNKRLDHFVHLGGKVIRTAVRKATGVELPLVTESRRIAGKPAIFVGNCRATEKAGFSSAAFARWEHAIAVKGRDIYIYGKDLPNPLKKTNAPWRFRQYTMGSLKGVCVFAEKFLNTRFVGIVMNNDDENDGVRTLPLKKIAVPDRFSYRDTPRFTMQNDQGGVLYSVANNYVYDCGTKFDVHYIGKVFPPEKFLKTKPEYFAIIDGKRYTRADLPQYCMSHPDIHKGLFEEALSRADAGYTVVELGQADGFIGCECPRCKAWYNTSDWSEKMWLFQRDMMEKLIKARPGIQVAIACYGVTHSVPETFNRFPGKGVFVNIAPATPELLEKWKKFNVTGMNAWAYDMGSYHACGFSPAKSFAALQQSVRFLKSTPVTTLYLCQYTTSFAINGPWIYAWGKFMGNKEVEYKELLSDYCRFAFGEKAAPYFIEFFTLIDKRMEMFPLWKEQVLDDLLGIRKRQSAIKLWQDRYPDDVLKKLTALFNEGIKRCDPANSMLVRLKIEFEYLCLSAEACNAAAQLEKQNDAAARNRLADALEKRNKFIAARPARKKDNWITDSFEHAKIDRLQRGGYMAGIFGGVFNSDPALLRRSIPETTAVEVKDFNDPRWNKLPALTLTALMNRSSQRATVRIGYNSKGILLKLNVPLAKEKLAARRANLRDTTKMWHDAVWEIFIADGKLTRQFAFSGAPGAFYDALIYAGGGRSVAWRPAWSVRETFKNGVWESCVTLPWGSTGLVPFRNGMRCRMQFAFSAGAQNISCWHLPLSGALHDISGFGGVRFGERPLKRVVDVNGDFKKIGKKGVPLNWSTKKLKVTVSKDSKGNLMELSGQVSRFDAAYNDCLIMAEADEEIVLTARMRGKGYARMAVSWKNSAGKWVSNAVSPEVKLSEKAQTVERRFSPGHLVQKGAEGAVFSIYLLKPGGTLVLESVKAEVRRKVK